MHGVREIIQEASSLPVEDRAIIIDSLLKTMNQPDNDIDREWSAVAHQRLNDLRSGKVRGVLVEELNQSQNGDTCFHLNGILEKQDKI